MLFKNRVTGVLNRFYPSSLTIEEQNALLRFVGGIDWAVLCNLKKRCPQVSYLHKHDPKAFPYIPFPNRDFIRALTLVKKHFPNALSFCDVGCGIGTKVALARAYGFKASGVELRKKYIKEAEKLYLEYRDSIKLFHQNAMDHNYSQYDVIYYYRPIPCDKLMRKLVSLIFDQMEAGSIVMSAGVSHGSIGKSIVKLTKGGFINSRVQFFTKVTK